MNWNQDPITFLVLIIVLRISGEHPGVYIIVYEHDMHLNDELLYAESGIHFLHLLHVNCNH